MKERSFVTSTELKKLQHVLTARQGELEQTIRNREGPAIEANPALLDQIQQSTDRELAIGNLERESRQLRDVRAALDRIRLGAFGGCPGCDKEIGVKRLAAVPWASSCIVCQNAEDRAYQLPGDTFDGEPLILRAGGL